MTATRPTHLATALRSTRWRAASGVSCLADHRAALLEFRPLGALDRAGTGVGGAMDRGQAGGRRTTGDRERLELLLETFRRADGERWALREIEEATAGAASASYLSSIRARRISRVGERQRAALARVMRFPVELWDAEPEEWPTILERKRRAVEEGSAPAAPVADLLEELFLRARHPLTGSAFTDSSAAELSGGRLTEEEVGRLRRGEIPDPPEETFLALCDVFGVPRSYWYGPATPPRLDEPTSRFLSGPRRLRALHMRLLELPEQERDEIGDMMQALLDRAAHKSQGEDDRTR